MFYHLARTSATVRACILSLTWPAATAGLVFYHLARLSATVVACIRTREDLQQAGAGIQHQTMSAAIIALDI